MTENVARKIELGNTPLVKLPHLPSLVAAKIELFRKFHRKNSDITDVTLNDFFELNQNLYYRGNDYLYLPTGNILEKTSGFIQAKTKTWQYLKTYLQHYGFDYSDMPALGREVSDGFENVLPIDFSKEKVLAFTIDSLSVKIYDLEGRIQSIKYNPNFVVKTITVAELFELTQEQVEKFVFSPNVKNAVSMHKLQIMLTKCGFTENDGEFMKYKFTSRSFDDWVEYYKTKHNLNHLESKLFVKIKSDIGELFIPEKYYDLLT